MPHQNKFTRYHFQGQRDKEEILSVIHRHWFNILVHFLIIFIFTLFLLGSLFFLPLLFPEIINAANERFFAFAENTFLIFMWLFSFLLWVDYYFDVWVITNERIVNIEQKGLFVREISELDFSRIQDVTTTVEGVIPTILNFGDVFVQTAGEKERFVFRQIPDPYRVKDSIMQLSRDLANREACPIDANDRKI
ncbi:MAG: PH domain-containing protein [Candidatus Moranbacteria bacterium]|nr:PH domain-containing protein [Candidatus Moranbacteria bacterium]